MPSMRIGGVALDLVGIPLSEETLTKAKNSDDVFLGAVGWPKWDNNSKHLKLNGAVAASYGSRSVFQFKTHHCLSSALLLLPHPLNRLLRFHAPPSDKVKIDAAIESVNFVSIMFLSRQSGGKVELQVLSLGQIENEHISCTSRKDEEEDENDKVSGGKELKYLESLS
ncbi:hypothetical protein YC2023_114030 [Brassica napus]